MKKLKIQTKINKLFDEVPSEAMNNEGSVVVMSPSKVFMGRGKTLIGDDLLRVFSDKEAKPSVSNLNYDDGATCKFDVQILKRIIDVFESKGEKSVVLKVKTDYPLTISDDDLEFILGPRMND